jgi:hypothetical protein
VSSSKLTLDDHSKQVNKTKHVIILQLKHKGITYFEFSGMIVDNDGLNICSRRVSMNDELEPAQNQISMKQKLADRENGSLT